MSFFANLVLIGTETAQQALDATGTFHAKRKKGPECTPCEAQRRADEIKARVAQRLGHAPVAPRRPKPKASAPRKPTAPRVPRPPKAGAGG